MKSVTCWQAFNQGLIVLSLPAETCVFWLNLCLKMNASNEIG